MAIPCSFQFEGSYTRMDRFNYDSGDSRHSPLQRDDHNDFNCDDGFSATTDNYKLSSHGDGSLGFSTTIFYFLLFLPYTFSS